MEKNARLEPDRSPCSQTGKPADVVTDGEALARGVAGTGETQALIKLAREVDSEK